MTWLNRCHFGDCRDTMRAMAADGVKVQTCVTSPPYFGLRDYGVAGQIGLEQTPEEYIATMVEVFRCVRDVLADDGTLWLNIGDSYARNPSKGGSGPGGKNMAYGDSYTEAQRRVAGAAGVGRRAPPQPRIGGDGIKEKDLIGIPWMLAFALRADGWYLRQDIVWSKPNPMPESVTDRCTKAHEYVFLLSKSARYYFDAGAIKEPVSPNTRARLSQDVQNQIGSARANGGVRADRPMKAVGRKFDPGAGNKNNASFDAAMAIMPEDRNRRSVWTVATKPYKGAHFATYPTELVEPCVLAGAPAGAIVIDPFFGSGTTGEVAQYLGRAFIGCELNTSYKPLQDERLRQPSLALEAA